MPPAQTLLSERGNSPSKDMVCLKECPKPGCYLVLLLAATNMLWSAARKLHAIIMSIKIQQRTAHLLIWNTYLQGSHD